MGMSVLGKVDISEGEMWKSLEEINIEVCNSQNCSKVHRRGGRVVL